MLLFDLGALPYAVLTAQPTWRTHGGELAELCAVKAGDRVLDLGCGPGESAFGMIERVPGAHVVGLDLSPLMIHLAELRRRFERRGAFVRFVRGDAMSLPFEDESFDAVTGHSFLYLVPDAERVLREVHRVLKPEGRCAFLEPIDGDSSHALPSKILREVLREPRFVVSMALWRIASKRYGRFSSGRFSRSFAAAGLDTVACRETLAGIGMFGVARKARR